MPAEPESSPFERVSASFLYGDRLLSPFPTDHEFQGYCRARFYSGSSLAELRVSQERSSTPSLPNG